MTRSRSSEIRSNGAPRRALPAAAATAATIATVAAIVGPPFLAAIAILASFAALAALAPSTAGARPDDAPTHRIHLPLVARALDRRDLAPPVAALPTSPPTDAPPATDVPLPTSPPPPTPTAAACKPLSERIHVATSDVGAPLRANDEYFPLPVAPRADGGSLVAWRDARSAMVRVGTFDADGALIGAPLSFAAEEVHAIVADADGGGGGALAVVDNDPDIYSAKYCRGPSTSDKALCGKMDVWRFDAAGKTVWRRTVTGKTNVDHDGAEFIWWYQHTARLVWTGQEYGLYYRNADSSPRPGVAGEIDIHAADAFRVLSKDGDILTHAWRWGCSHSWAVRLAFDGNGRFGTACHGDAYPNAFHVVVADRDRQFGEATIEENVDPTKRALGGLVAADGGFWLSYQSEDAGTMRLHLARIDDDGAVRSDDVLAAATGLPTAYPFRPYLAAYGDGQLLAGWRSGGRLQLAVLDGSTGALVEGPIDTALEIDNWNEFVSYPGGDGDVGWAWASVGGTMVTMVRVGGCR
ncbi:MAG: hypothetical protein ABI780_13840 [Ardenticatenales bacterium]